MTKLVTGLKPEEVERFKIDEGMARQNPRIASGVVRAERMAREVGMTIMVMGALGSQKKGIVIVGR